MALNTDTVKALQTLASQYAEPDMLMNLPPESSAMVADHILAQPQELQTKIFASHNSSIINAAQELFDAQEHYLKAPIEDAASLKGKVSFKHEIFINRMVESGVGLDLLMQETNSKLTALASTKTVPNESFLEGLHKMSNIKKAVIGGTVALGAAFALNAFHSKHPEQSPDNVHGR